MYSNRRSQNSAEHGLYRLLTELSYRRWPSGLMINVANRREPMRRGTYLLSKQKEEENLGVPVTCDFLLYFPSDCHA